MACVRRSVLSALMIVTFILCLGKVGRFHAVHHEQIHHYVMYYLHTLITIIILLFIIVIIIDSTWHLLSALYGNSIIS